MNKKILILLLGMVSLASCRHASKSSDFITVLATDTPSVINLPHDTLPIDRMLPTDMVAIDTFLLLMQHHEEKIIKVFSTNTCKFLGEFLRKGGGPNEVVTFGRISQWFMEDGEPKIVIQSYPNYLAVLNIQKSLEAKETVYDRKYTFETEQGKHLFIASNSVYEYNQSELMMTKDPIRSGIKDNSNDFWEFYDYGKDKVNRKIVYENFTGLIDPFSKSSNRLLKPDRKKVALLYSMVNLISIVDIEKAQIKQIYPEGRKFDIQDELKRDNRSSCLDEGECTDQYIFALSSNSQIDIYNWDGRYVYKADLGDKIRMFSVDNNQKFLYAVNSDDAIIRYDLSALK
ncbi:hypothetical protein [Bacteroides helcogenes]|uniref:Lipoprotein n=1 Tax=Bacteroides helcogenes (strain ATCC 35417 / DSM 20613 / JCM 6297 / CCUG 15421 / P 36-108) TaxID=693979 RepID=E6SN67_BACT6|nr:hypothetical protein [Bacteroides helcogenes]ADV44720.1 hypothetical protein Bache_2777 [Bacteroides helcogenes P 36-108]MDY5238519.1 hypothetical protein [Bacteroides helcogenes]